MRGGAIVGMGINSERYCSVGKDYRPEEKGNATYHAEIKAILNIPRHITKGSVMYVARCSKNGEDARMSKPCAMCHAVMEERGIRKVYYTEVSNIEDLQHEVISFLLSKIHLFDPSKGAKAYSYFGMSITYIS